MAYNVFGRTLNLAQLWSLFFIHMNGTMFTKALLNGVVQHL